MPLLCQALGSALGDKRCFSRNIWIVLGIWKVLHSPCFEHSVTSIKCYFEGHGTFRSWVLVGRNGLLSVAFEGYTFPWFWSSFLCAMVSYQVNSSVALSPLQGKVICHAFSNVMI